MKSNSFSILLLDTFSTRRYGSALRTAKSVKKTNEDGEM
jgi:hypothetical protein